MGSRHAVLESCLLGLSGSVCVAAVGGGGTSLLCTWRSSRSSWWTPLGQIIETSCWLAFKSLQGSTSRSSRCSPSTRFTSFSWSRTSKLVWRWSGGAVHRREQACGRIPHILFVKEVLALFSLKNLDMAVWRRVGTDFHSKILCFRIPSI